ncbi:MAG: cadherin-like domain-containing protein [Burkholderiaceae bacterium]
MAGQQAQIVWNGEGATDTNATWLKSFDLASPGFRFTLLSHSTNEDGNGNAASFEVSLTTPPTGTVLLALDTSDHGEAIVDIASLSFDSSNWSSPQIFTVTGVRDLVIDGDQAYDLTITTSAPLDAAYDNIVITQAMTSVDTDQALQPVVDSDTATTNTVGEDAAIGTYVGITALAQDPNAGDAVTYSIEGTSPFAIDAISGSITVADQAGIDFESTGGFVQVTVRAHSSDLHSADQLQTFDVAITDVPEAPSATASSILVQAGQTITLTSELISFSDPDGDAMQSIIVTGLPTGQLSIGGVAVNVGDQIDMSTLAAGAVNGLTYRAPVSANGGTPTAFTFKVIDTSGMSASSETRMDITFNAPPRITSHLGAGSADLDHDENTVPVTTIAVSDPDSANLTYTLSGDDAALFTFDTASSTLNWKAAPDFEAPNDLNNDGTYRVTLTVADAEGGQTSQSYSITVVNVVEPLSIQAPVQASLLEDGSIAFDGTQSVSIHDPDLANRISMDLTVSGGTVSVGPGATLRLSSGDGSAGSPLRLQGDAVSLNAALAGLVFTPGPDENGRMTLTIDLLDRNSFTADRTATATITIDVIPVNDAPQIHGSGAVVMAADDTLVLAGTLIQATDVEQSSDQLTFTLLQALVSGHLNLDGQPLGAGGRFTQADIDAGRITYTALSGDAASETIELNVADGAGGSVQTRIQIEILTVANGAAASGDQAGTTTGAGGESTLVEQPPADSGTAAGTGESAPPISNEAGYIGAADESTGAASAEPTEGAAAESALSQATAYSAGANSGTNVLDTGAWRKTLAPISAEGGDSFGFNGNRISDLEAFESLGSDRITDLAQVDRVWLETPMAESLQRTFAQTQERVLTNLVFEQKIAASSVAVSTGVSIGYVIWLLRGGALLSSIIASMPAWRSIDPLPVLQSLDSSHSASKDEESIESMLESANRQGAAQEPDADDIAHVAGGPGSDERPRMPA